MLPAGGAIALLPDAQGEIALDALPLPAAACASGAAGERLAQAGGHLALKDLLQQRGIAPWLRAAVPLLAAAASASWPSPTSGSTLPSARTRSPARDRARRLRWRRAGDGD